ncbi:unnamed protein product [Plasmodium vivax]|uniref:(malaria parasite P. vivax) hypothetical protein n=1 Tax=Plasmodium vivax TaxID=5855 RepID=A0A8S4H9W9_PLAVI|nr:unnamed protein product [Plasmodium vivax]
MENFRIVLSEDLRGGKVHAELRALLKEEEERDKHETEYGRMLRGGPSEGGYLHEGHSEGGHSEEGYLQEGHSKERERYPQTGGKRRTPLLERRTCHIYTDFPYKSHFAKNHERKNQGGAPSSRANDAADVNDVDDAELSGPNRVEETPPPRDLHLALILVIIDEAYMEEEHPLVQTAILSKIKKIQKAYDHVKVICLFIGVREYISRTSCSEEDGGSFHRRSVPEGGPNPLDGGHPKMNAKTFDRLIATLLVRHQVDSIEMENDKRLHMFIFKCCRYLHMSKVRKANSYFKVKPAGLSQLSRGKLNGGERNEELSREEPNEELSREKLNEEELGRVKLNEELGPPPPGAPLERRQLSTWVSQLMQISGLSEDASIKIAQTFHTPFDLIMHFKKKNDEECLKDFMISSSYGDRRLGRALSRKVFRVFSPGAHPHSYVS